MKTQCWVMFDSTGQESILDLDKYDLRLYHPFLYYPSTSSILGRDKIIILNLEHIKAIITRDEVWLRDPTNKNVAPIVEELRRRLPKRSSIHELQEDGKEYFGDQHHAEAAVEDESPFAFRALEVALEAICSFLNARATELEMDVYTALDELTSEINRPIVDKILKLKSTMTRMTARVKKIKDDMADLYLSRKPSSVTRVSGSGAAIVSSRTIGSNYITGASIATAHFDENDVEEIKILLEVYIKQLDETLNTLTTLREYTDDTEKNLFIQLDNQRKKLIKLKLYTCINLGTLCLTLFSLVGVVVAAIFGIFGMNITYTWNDDHGYMFNKWVAIIVGAIIVMSVMVTIFLCKECYWKRFWKFVAVEREKLIIIIQKL